MVCRIILALGAGVIGSLGNVMSLLLINASQGNFHLEKQFVYKQIFWGAAWALLYCFTFFKQNWIAKGVIVSALASIFTFFVFQSLPINMSTLLRVFIVNILVWGGISSWLYHESLQKMDKLS